MLSSRRRVRWGVLVLFLGSVACGDDGDEGGESAAQTSSEPQTTGASSTGSMSSDGSTSTTAGDGSSTSSTTSSTSDSGSTSAASTSSGTGGSGTGDAGTGAAVCDPSASDGECFTCVKSNCCVAWTLCQDDPICECTLECHVVDGNSLGQCRNQCGGETANYNGVYFCGQMNCLGLCDWQSP